MAIATIKVPTGAVIEEYGETWCVPTWLETVYEGKTLCPTCGHVGATDSESTLALPEPHLIRTTPPLK